MNPTASPQKDYSVWRNLLACLLVLGACALSLARTLDRDLNHDEHQFLAPAALVGRDGLLPWKDFPLYHLPNLVYAYAATDRLAGDLVLGAKLLNFVASAAVIVAIMALAARRAGWRGLIIGLSGVLLLLSDSLYRYTAGKTWNHEIPTALLLAAGGLMLIALKRDQLWVTAFAGVCGGLATGCRLTFAPTLVGMVVFVLLYPLSWRRRIIHIGLLTASATAALAPSLYSLWAEPERFIFGNFQFPRLRLIDPTNTRIQKTVTFWRKIRFFFKEIVLPSWPIFLLWGAVAVKPAWRWLCFRREGHPAAAFWLLQLPFILAGCFAPSRYQLQHFFVVIPVVLLSGVFMGSNDTQNIGNKRFATLALLLISIVLIWRSAADYSAISTVGRREEWFSTRLNRQAQEIQSLNPAGRILTLAPAIPLAAHLSIYPEFSTGTFGWRSAGLVSPERRRRLHLVAPNELEEFLSADLPGAVLTGVEEDEDEKPIVEWAKRHGYKPLQLKKKRVLWTPSARF